MISVTLFSPGFGLALYPSTGSGRFKYRMASKPLTSVRKNPLTSVEKNLYVQIFSLDPEFNDILRQQKLLTLTDIILNSFHRLYGVFLLDGFSHLS